MSGSLAIKDPFGQGNTGASRSPRAEIAPGVARLELGWTPHDYQEALLGIDRGIVLAAGGLGSGKSEPGALLLLRWALRHPRRRDGRPTRWFVLGPDFSRIRIEQLEKVLEHTRRLPVKVVKRVVGGQDPRIVLCHDQVLYGRSTSSPDRLRAFEVDGFWLDEAQAVPERAWSIAYSRLRSAAAPRVVITGSPEDSPRWLWALLSGENPSYNELRGFLRERGAGVWAHRWTSTMNTANQDVSLGSIKLVLEASARGRSRQELLGLFPGTHEAPAHGALDYSGAFVGAIALEPRDAIPGALGVDVGETDDFTWLTILSSRGVVLWQDRFNAGSPGVAREGFFPRLERLIEETAGRWRVKALAIDTAKHGKPLAQSLEIKLRGRVRVVLYDTGAGQRKTDAIEALGIALARKDVRIPTSWKLAGEERRVDHVDQLGKELQELEVREIGSGRRRFDHPPGGHDDGVVALALAWHALSIPGSATLAQGLGSWRPISPGPRFF